ncbi:hypothetical protein [Epibacterium ulvae]|uniref:hypothetical protein n=1 Tax=Epibacterium ulvae TaxID=1156985 RepID=UPI0024932603|nr:hypothetical protein [Epibacterium ulvae]
MSNLKVNGLKLHEWLRVYHTTGTGIRLTADQCLMVSRSLESHREQQELRKLLMAAALLLSFGFGFLVCSCIVLISQVVGQ